MVVGLILGPGTYSEFYTPKHSQLWPTLYLNLLAVCSVGSPDNADG